jgi:hypothetical protein
MGWENYYEGHEIEPGPFSGLLGLIFLPLILVLELVFGFVFIISSLICVSWLGVKEIKEKKKQKLKNPV